MKRIEQGLNIVIEATGVGSTKREFLRKDSSRSKIVRLGSTATSGIGTLAVPLYGISHDEEILGKGATNFPAKKVWKTVLPDSIILSTAIALSIQGHPLEGALLKTIYNVGANIIYDAHKNKSRHL